MTPSQAPDLGAVTEALSGLLQSEAAETLVTDLVMAKATEYVTAEGFSGPLVALALNVCAEGLRRGIAALRTKEVYVVVSAGVSASVETID